MSKVFPFEDTNLDVSVNFDLSDSENRSTLYFSDHEISEIAKARLNHRNLLRIFLLQAWTENRLKLMRKINFRKHQDGAPRAYCDMNLSEFEGINARQQWANWRTIPKNLSGVLEKKPVVAIDLCCGTGHSTEVLACYLPEGSKILGLEFNARFVEQASTKVYTHSSGNRCDVAFRSQSVLEPFRDQKGELLAPASIDLINCCGAVGVHFEPESTRVLAAEVARVLKRGGIAMIDSGIQGTSRRQLTNIFEPLGFEVCKYSRSCIFDIYTQVCFKKK